MTKDEIKKALECCEKYAYCKDCPCCTYCGHELHKDALALIIEQEKEIKKQNGRVKCLKTRLANKMVLLSNVEDLYESETQKLKEEKQELKTALKQSEDNYSRAFERLKAQEREIERLKAENNELNKKNWSLEEELKKKEFEITYARNNGYEKGYNECEEYMKDKIKQSQIDVLNRLKRIMTAYSWQIGINDVQKEIDRLIAEVENNDKRRY